MSASARRLSYLFMAIVAIAVTVRAVIGTRGLLEAHRAKLEYTRLATDVDKWRARNAFLESQIKSLREDPAAVEEIARERLGWVRPGEVTFLFPYDPSAPQPGEPAPAAPGEFAPEPGGDATEGGAGEAGSEDGSGGGANP